MYTPLWAIMAIVQGHLSGLFQDHLWWYCHLSRASFAGFFGGMFHGHRFQPDDLSMRSFMGRSSGHLSCGHLLWDSFKVNIPGNLSRAYFTSLFHKHLLWQTLRCINLFLLSSRCINLSFLSSRCIDLSPLSSKCINLFLLSSRCINLSRLISRCINLLLF